MTAIAGLALLKRYQTELLRLARKYDVIEIGLSQTDSLDEEIDFLVVLPFKKGLFGQLSFIRELREILGPSVPVTLMLKKNPAVAPTRQIRLLSQ